MRVNVHVRACVYACMCMLGAPEQQPVDDLQQCSHAGVGAVVAVKDGVANAAVAIDVAVLNGRHEANLGRRTRVIDGKVCVKQPRAFPIGRRGWALQHQSPEEHIVYTRVNIETRVRLTLQRTHRPVVVFVLGRNIVFVLCLYCASCVRVYVAWLLPHHSTSALSVVQPTRTRGHHRRTGRSHRHCCLLSALPLCEC
jgi:hypothetical protein